jgi:hypothetical protein
MSKKLTLLFLAFLTTNSFAQKTHALSDLFTDIPVVWYGIDYSHTEFVGNFDGQDLNSLFHAWNKIVFAESKYNIGRHIKKDYVAKDTAYVSMINRQTKSIAKTVGTDSAISKKTMASMVANYQSEQREGIGFVLIAERYNKPGYFATHYAVFFDISTRKILISQKSNAYPDGVGLRNYWAHSILGALDVLERSFKKWEKKYGK